MPRLIVLGASNALGSERSANTHLALETEQRLILIDAVNDVVVRLRQAGVDPLRLTDLILTHFHPDHVAGVPSLLMDLWLLGRTEPLHVYGLEDTLARTQQMMTLFDWDSWPNFYPVYFHPFPVTELTLLFSDDEILVEAVQVKHMVPTIGLRVTFQQSDKVWAYSCDTEPCDAVLELAGGADVLFHEAAGPSFGHTSPAEAGAIARRAEVGALYLIHYDTFNDRDDELKTEAEATFGGPVHLAHDFMELQF